MRFTVVSEAIDATPPTILVEGLEPVEGSIDATESPLIEQFDARVGIGYRGTVAAGRTLRLRPATSSWLGLEGGIARSRSRPGGDPTAPGPWAARRRRSRRHGRRAAPVARLRGLGGDRAARSTASTAGPGRGALADLPTVRCIAEDGDGLLIGTDSGLQRLEQHPEGEGGPETVAGDDGGQRAAGRRRRLAGRDRRRSGAPRRRHRVAVRADGHAGPHALPRPRRGRLRRDRARRLPAPAGHRPLVLVRRRRGERSDPRLAALLPGRRGRGAQLPGRGGRLPAAGARGAPGAGRVALARHRARSRALRRPSGARARLHDGARGVPGSRHRGRCTRSPRTRAASSGSRTDRRPAALRRPRPLAVPERARLGAAGPCRQAVRRRTSTPRNSRARLVALRARLGSVAAAPELGRQPPGCRSPKRRGPPTSRRCASSPGRTRRSPTCSATAEPEPVDDADLVVRYKPTETRIVDGGVPAIPRLPAGSSTWRYLALEDEDTGEPEQRPSWTREGRLLPPPPNRDAAPPGRFDLVAAASGEASSTRLYSRSGRPRACASSGAPRRPLSVVARLRRRAPDEHLEPAVLDRVYQGLEQVRPAGVNTALAVEEEIVERRFRWACWLTNWAARSTGELIRSQDWNALVAAVENMETTLNAKIEAVEDVRRRARRPVDRGRGRARPTGDEGRAAARPVPRQPADGEAHLRARRGGGDHRRGARSLEQPDRVHERDPPLGRLRDRLGPAESGRRLREPRRRRRPRDLRPGERRRARRA